MELGKSGVVLPVPIGIGTMQWGDTWLDGKLMNPKGNLTDTQVKQVYSTLISRGLGFLDSAEGYGGGTSEMRIRRVVKDTAEPKPIIATKFMPTLWRWSNASFDRALKGSMERLGVDCIDVYFIHTPVHPLPLEFWVECAARAANAGLIKAIGVSNCNADQVRRACKAAARHGQYVSANQILFSLLDYNSPAIREVERTCKQLGVTLVAYSPVGQGLLTEGLTHDNYRQIRVARMNQAALEWDKLQVLRQKIAEIAAKRGKTMAQVCLNWVICHGAIPLVGVRTLKHLEDNLGSTDWRLADEEVQTLDRVSLKLSTLDKPFWRRAIFVGLISAVVLLYRVDVFLESVWFSGSK
eukprot:TRINITY_DN32013_c0_g1_i1.p1 TRINITY_DN32013_c0_g1~~TRINITY_DN32013_c0_g1_i1.p1  ORF type:complete len:353 (+),score=67.65 TRINITY_DN32013_c0_g1_i1:879-1937(+)